MSVTQTATASKVKRAAIYPRVSTGQQEQEGTSLGTQEDRCRQYAAERGYVVDEAHIYREVHTGTELWERPQLTRLREAVRAHEVDVVIAYAIDRLSRDPVHLGVIVSEADHHGVDVEFVSEPLDNSPEGQLIRYVRGYAAKIEHEKIRERTFLGRRAIVNSGRLMAGPKPRYGYAWRDEETPKGIRHVAYDPDPLTATVVRQIFQMSRDGISTWGIAKALTDEGIPSPAGCGAWQHVTVRRVLVNPIYVGRGSAWRERTSKNPITHRRQTVQRLESEWVPLTADVAPALVDEESFALAQHRLATNKERATRNNKHPEVALLRGGLGRCGYCGGSLIVLPKGRDGCYVYRCSRASDVGGTCHHGVQVDLLDAAVWEKIDAIRHNPELIAQHLAEQDHTDDTSAEDLAAVDRHDSQLAKQQANLIDSLSRIGGTAGALIESKLKTLDKERERLVDEREAIQERVAARERAKARVRDLTEWCEIVGRRLDAATYQQKRLALDVFQLQVRLWRQDHTPRWEITASPDLDSPIVGRTS